jgi:hypothetical protein
LMATSWCSWPLGHLANDLGCTLIYYIKTCNLPPRRHVRLTSPMQ